MAELRYAEATRGDIERIAAFNGISDPALYEHEHFARGAEMSTFGIALDGETVVGTQAFIAYDMNVGGRTVRTGRSERTLVAPAYRGQDILAKLMDQGFRLGGDKGMQFFWGAGTDALKAFRRSGFLDVRGHREFLVAAVDARSAVREMTAPENRSLLNPKAALQAWRASGREEKLRMAALALTPALISMRLPAKVIHAIGADDGLQFSTTLDDSADFDGLYARLKNRRQCMYLTHGREFLKWCLDDANHAAQWVFAYRGGELVAYACLEMSDPTTAMICDFAAVDGQAFRAVLEEARILARRNGQAYLLVVSNRHAPAQRDLYKTFLGAGFIPFVRGGSSVIRAGRFQDMNYLAQPQAWYMTELWGMLYQPRPSGHGAADQTPARPGPGG